MDNHYMFKDVEDEMNLQIMKVDYISQMIGNILNDKFKNKNLQLYEIVLEKIKNKKL